MRDFKQLMEQIDKMNEADVVNESEGQLSLKGRAVVESIVTQMISYVNDNERMLNGTENGIQIMLFQIRRELKKQGY